MDELFSWPCLPTRVVNMREEDYDIRIDRKTKWGNPFIVGVDGTRQQCVDQYREWIMTQPHLLDSLHEIKGKRLGCWCHPNLCHGDILAHLADKS